MLESPRVHDLLVTRVAIRVGIPPIKAHLAVRRVALGLTPDQYTPLVLEEARLAAQEAAQRTGQLITDIRRVLMPQMRALSRTARHAAEALDQLGLVNQEGMPVRRQDRPAWQSPYGPPKRR
ncbi:hypothetical protein [Streptomyces sp. NBC_00670]|uniref:hypothetical protein n=1 Tax=Streptomyces sp. NBC_00670 TaxID=2975804 RepID=UPI002E34E527|nr:hypothetical protein [Streptomyces sp. NBC_00670]